MSGDIIWSMNTSSGLTTNDLPRRHGHHHCPSRNLYSRPVKAMRYLIKVLVSRMGWAARVMPDSSQNTSVAASWSLTCASMALSGIFQQRRCSWPFCYIIRRLQYRFVVSGGSAVFYALMPTNVRKKPVIFTGYQRRRKCMIET